MAETWIVALIAPAILTVLGWIINRMDKTAKLVATLQGEIDRLNEKVLKLEQANEGKDRVIAQERATIQEAYRCKTPSYKCPVLLKQAEFNNWNLYDKRTEEQQPREHTPEQDDIPGGDDRQGCVL